MKIQILPKKLTIHPWPLSKKIEYNIDVPIKKLPNCHICGEDELSMLASDCIFCNVCCKYFEPQVYTDAEIECVKE